jgi:copper transport protein
VKRGVLASVLVVFLLVPATASAHATLVATVPADGAVLAKAPTKIRVLFDDRVRVGSGNAVVANTTGASVLDGAAHARGRTLILAVLPRLRDGDYSVRWAIVSDDGHLERGVLAFAVGAGRSAPHSVLGAAVPLTWSDILLRTLYYLGLLTAGGTVVFGLLVRRLVGGGLLRPVAHLLFFGLLAVFIGGSGIVHTAAPGTRYVLVLKVALVVALAGGTAAALAPAVPRLLPVAGASALALLAAPTLAGHALDPNQPHALSVPADVAHVAAAATWLGGLLGLVYVLPRSGAGGEASAAATRRVSASALAALAVLAASGLGRAFTELSGVAQVWDTSYGRALVAKTALLAAVVAVAAVSRRYVRSRPARVRRPARVEVLVLAAIVVSVSVLTELRPGRDRPHSPPTVSAPSRER